jgi:hypothetical protein
MRKIFLVCLIVLLISISGCQERGELKLVPKEKVTGAAVEVSGTEIGTGWSTNANEVEAVQEAVSMALQDKTDKTPEFAIVYASSGSDMKIILSKIKEALGTQVKIFGGTTDSRWCMTEKGFLNAEEKGYQLEPMKGDKCLTIMTISSEDIDFGVASAEYIDEATVQERSKAAALAAIKDAGRTPDKLPTITLIALWNEPAWAQMDEVVAGIEEIITDKTRIMGGCVGGPEFGIFGQDDVYSEGISVAVLYTDLPLGLSFESGFEVKGPSPYSGIVTKAEGITIYEIDNKPALDVYNEWLGGEIDRLANEVGDPALVKDLLTVQPLYRKYTSDSGADYFLFSHPWPHDPEIKGKGVDTGTVIKEGERVYLSHGHGTWQVLMNEIVNSPKKAKVNAGLNIDEKPILGIQVICCGVVGTIPAEEREKMAGLINYGHKNAPFITLFAWGEQGHYSGVGNKHGNLHVGFTVIGKEK